MDALVIHKVGPVDTTQSPYSRLRTLPLDSVSLTGGFWSQKQVTNREATIPHVQQMLERGGAFDRLRFAAGLVAVAPTRREGADHKVFKWLEGIVFELARGSDDALARIAEQTVQLIAAAQEEDGYLYTYGPAHDAESRWRDLAFGHELFSAGHLMQAAVTHHRATGDTKLLQVARRFADYIDSVFGPNKRAGTGGHPEVEMALVELYRDSREQRYLELARFFVDQRGYGTLGTGGRFGGSDYLQDHVPVREASMVAGHAVRQLYLNCGVTDLYLETGERALLDALMRLWEDMSSRKLFITGGVGSRYMGEAFGEPYELPNDRCYCETCAQIASIMWSWRMLLATGESRFADLIERTLYNGFLSGVSLDGRRFFYVNSLMTRGTQSTLSRPGASERQEWFSTPCCPPNVVRLIASLGHYLATTDSKGLQIHLYDSARIDTKLASGRRIVLRMETDYPWDGQVHIAVEAAEGSIWRLALRRPGWCEGMSLRINGQSVDGIDVELGYITIERPWRTGDVVELNLSMAPHLVEAHPRIDPTRCSVAIERGPIVYCLEQWDQEPSVDVNDVQINETVALQTSWDEDLLDGIVVIKAAGYAVDTTSWEGRLYRPLEIGSSVPRRPIRLTAIPYCVWANRGLCAMRVWIPRGGKSVH